MEAAMSPRREIWGRYRPFHLQRNIELVILDIADDLDTADQRYRRIEDRLAKLTGIALGLLISVTTGVLLLGIQLATGR
jgi:hypothetical protein